MSSQTIEWGAMTNRPDVSVVVVNCNRREQLWECLRTLAKKNGVSHEVIMIDHGSIYGSSEMMHSEYPEVLVYRTEEILEPDAALHFGMLMAEGRNVISLEAKQPRAPGSLARRLRQSGLGASKKETCLATALTGEAALIFERASVARPASTD